jgi:hypothetical protein
MAVFLRQAGMKAASPGLVALSDLAPPVLSKSGWRVRLSIQPRMGYKIYLEEYPER